MINPADEHAHPPGSGPHWEESWNFDFATSDGRLAGYARLGVRAADRRAWWWTAIVGQGRPLVLVRDHDIDPPRAGTLEIRGTGLWAEPVCEMALEHWGLGLEAFAISLDDPNEAYGAERGDPTPLGLDLEWERDGEPAPLDARRNGYRVPAVVHGEVLVGSQRLMVAGTGTWEHAWGERDWWAPAPTAGGPVDGEEVFSAPVQVPAPDGRVTRVARALCRVENRWVWVERVNPPPASSAD
jgi:hypothetical protein